MRFDYSYEAFLLADTWARWEDLKKRGQRVAMNKNTLEINQLGADTPPAGYEVEIPDLKGFLEIALPVLISKAGLDIESVRKALSEAEARIAQRNRQIRDLRQALRK